ncbi:MAG: hypothetical protein ACTSXG_03920 [Alphaproteobacteria bacterium]
MRKLMVFVIAVSFFSNSLYSMDSKESGCKSSNFNDGDTPLTFDCDEPSLPAYHDLPTTDDPTFKIKENYGKEVDHFSLNIQYVAGSTISCIKNFKSLNILEMRLGASGAKYILSKDQIDAIVSIANKFKCSVIINIWDEFCFDDFIKKPLSKEFVEKVSLCSDLTFNLVDYDEKKVFKKHSLTCEDIGLFLIERAPEETCHEVFKYLDEEELLRMTQLNNSSRNKFNSVRYKFKIDRVELISDANRRGEIKNLKKRLKLLSGKKVGNLVVNFPFSSLDDLKLIRDFGSLDTLVVWIWCLRVSSVEDKVSEIARLVEKFGCKVNIVVVSTKNSLPNYVGLYDFIEMFFDKLKKIDCISLGKRAYNDLRSDFENSALNRAFGEKIGAVKYFDDK